jgi:hypothetical protein
MQGRGPVIDAEQARVLGLRNGQVVQAIIDGSASAFSVIWPSGQRQGLPTALQAFPLPSQWRWAAGTSQELMAVLMPGGHIMLRPVRPGAAGSAFSAATAASIPTSAASVMAGSSFVQGSTQGALGSGAYSLGQAFAMAQATGGPGSSAEVARLLQQAPAWAGLMRVLQFLMTDATGSEAHRSGVHEEDALSPLHSRLADMMGAPLPRMGNLTPELLRQAVARSGLGTEAALMAGSLGLDQDLKVALRRLMRSVPSTALDQGLKGLSNAVDTLERSSLDSLGAQMQGQLLLSMVIPFGDAGPVALRISQERARLEEEPPPFVVDVHSAHSGLGPLWLRTQIAHDQRVAITMWAARTEVADEARARSQELRRFLHDSGLQLSSLEVVAGTPEPDEDLFLASGAGP